jgi:hypothetical protein
VAFGRSEVSQQAGSAGNQVIALGELDLAVGDEQERPLVDLVLPELLARR